MLAGNIIEDISAYARVATAVSPFVVAILARLIFGKNRMTRVLLSLTTTWFAINVLLTPYSVGMQHDLLKLRDIFR